MSKQLQHKFVHWIDGMKVNKSHFIQDQLATVDLVRDAASRFASPINYGLLLPEAGKSSSLESSVVPETNGTLNISVTYCRATTANGTLIDISPQFPLTEQLVISKQIELAQKPTSYYVVLVADAFSFTPNGVPNPAESPARQPYVATAVSVQFLNEEDISTHKSSPVLLPIAKVIIKSGKAEEDVTFIPPSTASLAYPDLADVMDETVKFYAQMEQFALTIIQKVHQKNQQNELALLMLGLSQQMLGFINFRYAALKWEAPYRSPFALYEINSSFARVIYSFLESRMGTGKEEMINYITEWCDLTQGQFESSIAELLQLPYNHSDINKSLVKITEFAKTLSIVFSKLAKLDYIGKKKETNIFVKEEPVSNIGSTDAKPKVKRSFLAD